MSSVGIIDDAGFGSPDAFGGPIYIMWNETGAALALTITPPWWETAWFRLSTVHRSDASGDFVVVGASGMIRPEMR